MCACLCVIYVVCMCYVRVPHVILARVCVRETGVCVCERQSERGHPSLRPCTMFECVRVGGCMGVCVHVWVREWRHVKHWNEQHPTSE